MSDYDVVIIGSGPAGLTAGIYLARGRYRTLILENNLLGGQIKNVEWIENYPGFSKGIGGPQLAFEMVEQATAFGVKFETGNVTGIENYSGCRSVQCSNGTGYTADAVIVASGCRRKKLGIPGEETFQARGVIECALCDGDQFADKTVAVCGGGDSGITEALYLSRIAGKVILMEAMPKLTASKILQERAKQNPKLEIHIGIKAIAIGGNTRVETIEFEGESGEKGSFAVDGVLIDIGLDPNTAFVKSLVALDTNRHVIVNERYEASIPGIYAIGDIRSNSPKQVTTAVGDGASCAVCVQRFLNNSG